MQRTETRHAHAHTLHTQILYNLTGNALKFTNKGRVGVRVEPSADGTHVLLQVGSGACVWEGGESGVARMFGTAVQRERRGGKRR